MSKLTIADNGGQLRSMARAIVGHGPRSFAIVGTLLAAGCHTDMWRQPKEEPLGISKFYVDGASSRPLTPGTIARDHLREDSVFYTGVRAGRWVDNLPMPLTKALIDRGQERYDIFCSPCHGRLGDGQGMIAQRGFTLRRPVGNYHTPRLRNMPVGYLYDVITNGYGTMYGYASRIEPRDRWAIVAYVRALQLSHDQDVSTLSPSQRAELAKSAEKPFEPRPFGSDAGGEHGEGTHSEAGHAAPQGAANPE